MNDFDAGLRNEMLLHVNVIANRLWSRRAAILVGAGFSRNADANYPDWHGLADLLWDRLHLNNKGKNEDKKYVDVMQLAEEFVATFGRPALDAMIAKSCYHPEVAPSALHKELLSLPWVDVFTTNYDTLLEKAASDIREIKYGYVLTKEDLSYTEKPRIIKLHGSFPSTHPFVLTAKDYRQYKYEHSPFVNTVQQSLLENTFCLLGFSGDDPNFLKWIEWMHHNLGERNVQKIYLLLVSDISHSRRELLKDRGIIPVDLRALISGADDPKKAISALVQQLKSLGERKTAWPKIPKEFEFFGITRVDATFLSNFVGYIKELRITCPPRLILPERERQMLQISLGGWLTIKADNLMPLDNGLRFELLYGLVWLSSITRTSMTMELIGQVYQAFFELVKKSKLSTDENAALPVMALALLRAYREHGVFDEWDRVWSALQLYKAEYGVGFLDDLKYEQCLYAEYRLHIAECARLVRGWEPDISSSIACARKVGLLVKLGEFEKGKRLAEEALNWLRGAHSGRDSQKDLRYASAESALMITIRRIERYLNSTQESKTFHGSRDEDVGQHPDEAKESSDGVERLKEEEQARQKERQDEEAQSEKKFFDRHYELKKIKCDMTDELRGYAIALGEIQRHCSSTCYKRWLFDVHEQQLLRDFRNPRFNIMVSTSFFRFIEEVGLTIRVGNGFYIDKDLLASSIDSIWEALPCLAFSTLALYGNVETIERVLDRKHLLGIDKEQSERCISELLLALNNVIECKSRAEGVWGTLYKTAPEIISRLISRCGINKRLEVARFVKAAYSLDGARHCLDLRNLIMRLFCGATLAELKKIVVEILPDEAYKCASVWERMHFQHPLRDIGFESIAEESVDNNYSIPSITFTRLRKQLQSRERFEYEWGLDTLRAFLHLGCLSEKQKQELRDVIDYRMMTAFPIGRESYYLLILHGGTGGIIGEKFKNRMLRKILHPFDELEDGSMSNIRVRRYVRDMQVMLRDLMKVNTFIPMVIDRTFASNLGCKLVEWLNGSRKWVDVTLEHGPRSGLTLLALISDVMTKVVIANLSADEYSAINVNNDMLSKKGAFVRWELAAKLKANKVDYDAFADWAWTILEDADNNDFELALLVLHDIACSIPCMGEGIILRFAKIIKIRGYWNSINLIRRLSGFIGDESIVKTNVVLDRLISMLGDIKAIGQYDFAYNNAIPIEQCISLRSSAVRIALIMGKLQQATDMDANGFLEYWLDVSMDADEFSEVRIGA